MLIVFSGKPDGHYRYRSFVNLNCVDSAYIEMDYDDNPFLSIGGVRVFFKTQDGAISMFDDIVAAYARGDKVFYINLDFIH